MKKHYIIIAMLVFLIISIATLITAFLLDAAEKSNDITVGSVKAETIFYYEKDGIDYPGAEVVIDSDLNLKKKGIYNINVVDSQAVEFVENVRIDVNVESDVDTYIRIKLFEQMILTTINYLGERTEVSIITEPTEFNYSLDDWYYNEEDDYYYHKHKVKRLSENEPAVLPFIIEYFPDVHYHTQPLGYSIQMGIRTEAVQAQSGPQNNWNMEVPPWGEEW